MYVTPKIFGVALNQSRQIPGLFHQSEVRFLFGAPTADSGVSFIVPFLWRKSSAPKERTFQIGFTTELYVQVRACYLKTAAGKKRREIWSSLKDPISFLYKALCLERRTMPSPIVGRCLALPPKKLNSIVAIEKSVLKPVTFEYSSQTRFLRERRVALGS